MSNCAETKSAAAVTNNAIESHELQKGAAIITGKSESPNTL